MARYFIKRLLVASVISVSALPALAQERTLALASDAPIIGETSDQLKDALGDIRKLLSEIDQADEKGGMLTRGKAGYQDKLNKELSALLTNMTGDEYQTSRDTLLKADAKISAKQVQVEELKADLVFAPKGAGTLGLKDKALMRDAAPGSENDLKAQITTLRADLSVLEQGRDETVQNFAYFLNQSYGFDITREQAEALLYQANGGTIVQAKMVLEIIAGLQRNLAEQQGMTKNAALTQRYYGIAAVSRLMIVRMYEMHLDDYDNVWLPKLDQIEASNEALNRETRQKLASANAAQREQYQINLRIQKRVADSITGYRKILQDRRQATINGLKKARTDADVAVNTLKTLESVFAMSSEILSSTAEYNTLMSIQTPELIPLDDAEMAEQYLSISTQLAGA